MLLLPLIAKTGIFSYMLTIQIVIWSDIIRITANMKKDFKIAVLRLQSLQLIEQQVLNLTNFLSHIVYSFL